MATVVAVLHFHRIVIMKPAIAYIRVSKPRQGRSGLGLEAQQTSIALFCEVEGFAIQATFTEVETGKGFDALERRPQLAAALADARKLKCAVIVAKLDGLNAKGIKNREAAKERAQALLPILAELNGMSARAIAAQLNLRSIPTPNGGPWYAVTVIRVQRRLEVGL